MKKKTAKKKKKEKIPEAFTKKHMEMLLDRKEGLTRYYSKVKFILKKFMDMDEEYYSLVSLWVVGTYFHKQFSAYPYLYFNAMKGAGKTRVLKIIATLSKNGELLGSMTEAVLFRTASESSFCIDELENTNEKGKENVRLLLNSAYKKGMKVKRMEKRKVEGEVQQIPVAYDVYCPIAMANIWGLENVLQDRCISVILEKSSKNQIIKLIENFENDIRFQTAKGGLMRLTENLKDEQGLFNDVIDKWNSYVLKKNIVSSVSKVSSVKSVNKVKKRTDDIDNIDDFTILFQNIDKTNLNSRDLELFFPLFILADMIGKKVFEELLETSQKIVKSRREADREESKDVKLIEFIAQSDYEGFVNISDIAKEFSEFSGEDPKYNTPNSVSRVLNRLKLILDKRSTGRNRQAKLDVSKAKEKLLMFKEPEKVKGIAQFTDEEIKKAGWTKDKLKEMLK